MDPAAKLEQVVRLQAVLLAHERGDRAQVCEEGEAYLAEPDAHLDLVTYRPNVHALVARSYDALEWPDAAVGHYDQALLGVAHLHVVDPADLRLAAALARLRTGRYRRVAELLAAAMDEELSAEQRAFGLRLAAVHRWRATGDLDAADALLARAGDAAREAAEVAAAAGVPAPWWHVGAYRGQMLAEAERLDEAAEVLDAALEELARHHAEHPDRPGGALDLAITRAVAAQVAVRRGELDRALSLVRQAEGPAVAERASALAHHLLVEAEARVAAGDRTPGEAAWLEGLDLAAERGLRPTEVLAWEVRARTTADAGERAEALARARDLAEALGHVADQARLARLAGG